MECVVPTQVKLLGEAMAPIAATLHAGLEQPAGPSDASFGSVEDVGKHVEALLHALQHFEPQLGLMMGEVLGNEAATALDVGRTAGRMEQVLREFVDGYHRVQGATSDASFDEDKSLVVDAYRHILTEIAAWLDHLVAAIANPLAELQRQGIDPEESVVLPITLNLTTPPQFERLAELAEAHRLRLEQLQADINALAEAAEAAKATEPPEPFDSGRPYETLAPEDLPEPYEAPRPARPGFFPTIGALAFGYGVARWIRRMR